MSNDEKLQVTLQRFHTYTAVRESVSRSAGLHHLSGDRRKEVYDAAGAAQAKCLDELHDLLGGTTGPGVAPQFLLVAGGKALVFEGSNDMGPDLAELCPWLPVTLRNILFEKMAAARPGRVITIVDDDRPERHFAVIAVPPNFVNE